jgi:EAL domain-containing protein (putative c-di-GMP-specific phosphodiesterase class I)
VAMGNALGLEVVAEGVETAVQAGELRRLGCRSAQGYLRSRRCCRPHPDTGKRGAAARVEPASPLPPTRVRSGRTPGPAGQAREAPRRAPGRGTT